jgi:hypothetical protein
MNKYGAGHILHVSCSFNCIYSYSISYCKLLAVFDCCRQLAMASISKISYLIKRGRVNDAIAAVQTYPKLLSSGITVSGEKSQLVGLVLHVSKTKKVNLTKAVGEKKFKREVAYHRLVFCR